MGKQRLGEKVKQVNDYNEEDAKRRTTKRKGKSDSPVKIKSRKVEKSKSSNSNKKSSKRSVVVDEESSDDKNYRNLKITKSANTSSDLNKSDSNMQNSSKDYAPIKNRKIKLKKKKGSEDMSDVSSLLPWILARRGPTGMSLMETSSNNLMIS